MGPKNFIRIVFQTTMGMLQIPSKFVESFDPILGKITGNTNTRCS
jgi:hypothetical protein